MKNIYIGIMASVIVLISAGASAGQNWCSGTIQHLYLNHDGALVIHGSWRGTHTEICNINEDRLGVTPEVCKGWLSVAMAAKLSTTTVILHYPDVPSCAAIPQYSGAPRPTYLMLSE